MRLFDQACRATLCLAIFAANAPAQSSTLTPGIIRSFGVDSATPVTSSLSRLTLGDYDGDLRQDAAILVESAIDNHQLCFVLGVAGYGVSLSTAPPGGGSIQDIASFPGGTNTPDAVLVLVHGGTQAGLYLAYVEGSDVVFELMRANYLGNVQSLEVVDRGAHNEIFGLVEATPLIERVLVDGSEILTETQLILPAVAKDFSVDCWGGNAIKDHLFANTETEIHIIPLDESPITTITPGDTILDYDVEHSPNRLQALLAISTVDSSGANSWVQIHGSNGSLDGPLYLGVSRIRLNMRDMRGTGEVDLNGLCTHGPVAFTALAQNPAPGYTFADPNQYVGWSFISPNFGGVSHRAHLRSADVDDDGDPDFLHVDPGEGKVWVQPNIVQSEVGRAPTITAGTPTYRNFPVDFQRIEFDFEEPIDNFFAATHVQVTVYQRLRVSSGEFEFIHLGGETLEIANLSVVTGVNGRPSYNTGIFNIDDAFYEGVDGTHADLVAGVRCLQGDASNTGFGKVGPESFIEVPHTRNYIAASDTYDSGSFGGVNPIPNGSGGGGNNGPVRTPPPVPVN